jgi:hypothetical protein
LKGKNECLNKGTKITWIIRKDQLLRNRRLPQLALALPFSLPSLVIISWLALCQQPWLGRYCLILIPPLQFLP